MNKFTTCHSLKKILVFSVSIILLASALFNLKLDAKAAGMSDSQAAAAVFDPVYYANNNPDVVAAYGNSTEALLKHYRESGIYEGRSASAEFNATAYRARYADLNAAYSFNWFEYCRHYVTCGKNEGRNASAGGPSFTASFSSDPVYTSISTDGYDCLGSYSTKYVASQARGKNIKLAAGRLNGKTVAPGAEFSYSNAILPRTVQNGYVEAPVFINKEHAMGIGGGICQVSSTLYACMKTIGLPATERHPHSLPVSYVPTGWDATISGTTLDLKFVNPYSNTLLITATPGNGTLTVSLWLKK